MKRYEDIDQKILLDKWLNFNDVFSVYLHSPFCPSICKFCIYAGVKHNNNTTFNDYYNFYLPKVIEFYRPVLEKKTKNIVSWFFGGGTPSLIPPEKLNLLLNSLPNFKNHNGEKVFELHPGAFHIEQLDVLKEHNFNVVILCQQTLDQQTLKDQNRVHSDLKTLIFLADECKKRNLKIGLDIISFLNKKKSDSALLEKDLELTFNYIKPDQISIQCLYQEKDSENNFNEITVDAVFNSDYINKKNYLIEDFTKNYLSEDLTKNKFSLEDLKNSYKNLKCLRLYKKDTNINFKCVDFMDPGWTHGFNPYASTLALGSFKNPFTQTHSNIKEFNYVEVNTDNKTPHFKLVSSSYLNEIDFFTSIFKKVGEPPKGITFKFQTNFYREKQVPLFLCFDIFSDPLLGENQQYIDSFIACVNEEKKFMIDRLKNKNNFKQILIYN